MKNASFMPYCSFAKKVINLIQKPVLEENSATIRLQRIVEKEVQIFTKNRCLVKKLIYEFDRVVDLGDLVVTLETDASETEADGFVTVLLMLSRI